MRSTSPVVRRLQLALVLEIRLPLPWSITLFCTLHIPPPVLQDLFIIADNYCDVNINGRRATDTYTKGPDGVLTRVAGPLSSPARDGWQLGMTNDPIRIDKMLLAPGAQRGLHVHARAPVLGLR
jgi:hypothetical protein